MALPESYLWGQVIGSLRYWEYSEATAGEKCAGNLSLVEKK